MSTPPPRRRTCIGVPWPCRKFTDSMLKIYERLVHTHTFTHTYAHTNTHTQVQTHTRTNTRYRHIHAHIHTRIYIHEFVYRPRMQKSHSGCPRTGMMCSKYVSPQRNESNDKKKWSSVNLLFNLRAAYSRLQNMYSVISVIVDSLPAKTGARQAEGL